MTFYLRTKNDFFVLKNFLMNVKKKQVQPSCLQQCIPSLKFKDSNAPAWNKRDVCPTAYTVAKIHNSGKSLNIKWIISLTQRFTVYVTLLNDF